MSSAWRRAPDKHAGAGSFLRQVAELMWPPPATVELVAHAVDAPADGLRWVCIPSAEHPVLLLPDKSPRAAAAILLRYAEAGSRAARARLLMLAAAFRLGAAQRIFRGRLVVRGASQDRSLDTVLQELFGTHALGVHLGPARANRKPVLTVVSPEGELLGYVKVGVNALTRELVSVEAAALEHLADADLGPVRVAQVLHHGTCGNVRLLVQSALPVWQRRVAPTAERLREALLAIAHTSRVEPQPLTAAPAWLRTRASLANAAGRHAAALRAAGMAVEELGHLLSPVGAWHGDFHPGNYAILPDGVLVWDWERYGDGAPVGWDALHDRLQTSITMNTVQPRLAATDLVSNASSILTPLGVPQDAARMVALSYLVHLGARYSRDDQEAGGSRLGRLDEWLLPVLQASLTPPARTKPSPP